MVHWSSFLHTAQNKNKKSAGKSCKTAVDRHQMRNIWKKIKYKKIML